MIVVFDGPNKAGKSTFIEGTRRHIMGETDLTVEIRKWGPLETDDREYTESLLKDAESDAVVLWDRSWVSEHVYGAMLGRDRRLANDPLLGELLHTRGLNLYGMGFIILPVVAGINIAMLDEDDKNYTTNVYTERSLFMQYANKYHWHTVYNNYNEEFKNAACWRIAKMILDRRSTPPEPTKVAFVKSGSNFIPGGWLPFSDTDGLKFLRYLDAQINVGGWFKAAAFYTSMDTISDGHELIYTLDDNAHNIVCKQYPNAVKIARGANAKALAEGITAIKFTHINNTSKTDLTIVGK